jgi:mannose/fructose/N-acetylgalactosamine-specific phosphotransferase system component IIC
MSIKQRILTGWTFTRAMYVVLGIAFIINSIINQQWIGILFGGYFASMGIFAFGCAAGNCNIQPSSNKSKITQDIAYEEIKQN